MITNLSFSYRYRTSFRPWKGHVGHSSAKSTLAKGATLLRCRISHEETVCGNLGNKLIFLGLFLAKNILHLVV